MSMIEQFFSPDIHNLHRNTMVILLCFVIKRTDAYHSYNDHNRGDYFIIFWQKYYFLLQHPFNKLTEIKTITSYETESNLLVL